MTLGKLLESTLWALYNNLHIGTEHAFRTVGT